MLTAEGQHFICPLNMGYIPYQRVILAFKGIFLPEKRVLQDMICCPSAVNKCPFKRTYYFIFGNDYLVFGNIICCPFRMYCLAPYTVPLGPTLWLRCIVCETCSKASMTMKLHKEVNHKNCESSANFTSFFNRRNRPYRRVNVPNCPEHVQYSILHPRDKASLD